MTHTAEQAYVERPPLTKPCPDCEDGTIWRSKYGGNDPDVWPVRCERCDGTGELPVTCEGWQCHEPAVTRIGADPCCAVHAAAWLADDSEATSDV